MELPAPARFVRVLAFCVAVMLHADGGFAENAQVHAFAHTMELGRGAARFVTEHIAGQTIPFGGGILRLGEYYATIQVGGQSVNVQVDTGSSSLALPDMSCSNCVDGNSPPYTPSLSRHFRPLQCSSDCPDGVGGLDPCSSISGFTSMCQFELAYGDSSGCDGVLASDSVSLSTNLTTTATFGRILAEVNGFGRQEVPGILGVGYQNINFFPISPPTVLDQLSADTGLPRKFGMCLTVGGGAWDVGFVNPARAAGPLQSVPCSGSRGYYAVTLNSISVGSYRITTSSSLTIVDSGTTLLVLPSSVINSFLTALYNAGSTQNLPGYKGLTGTSQCTSDLQPSQLALYPNLTFTFGTVTVKILPKYYILAVGSSYCLGLASLGTTDIIILGDVFMQSLYTVFDKDSSTVQFAPLNTSNCPGYSDMPIPVPAHDSLSSGAVAGIVIGCLCAVILVAALCWWRRKRYQAAHSYTSGLLQDSFAADSATRGPSYNVL